MHRAVLTGAIFSAVYSAWRLRRSRSLAAALLGKAGPVSSQSPPVTQPLPPPLPEAGWMETIRSGQAGCSVQVLQPGLVVVRGLLGEEAQLWLVRAMFQDGHALGRWWARESHDASAACGSSSSLAADGGTGSSTAAAGAPWELNAARQGRGRVYDAVERFRGGDVLRELCMQAATLAREHDPVMPALDPTHMLCLYYATTRHLGWHRDSGAQDGQSECPVVSISLGNACDFWLRHNSTDEPIKVRLDSGDVILFGGPCRHILHTVKTVWANTCPSPLLALHRECAALAPRPSLLRYLAALKTEGLKAGKRGSGGKGGGGGDEGGEEGADFRLNLTFRHAPELLGQEGTERFHMFAASQRVYLAALQQLGPERAREQATLRRQAKQHAKQQRKEARALRAAAAARGIKAEEPPTSLAQ